MNVYYSVEEKLLQADMLMHARRYLKAHRLFKEVLEDEPDNAFAHFGIAFIMRYMLHDNKTAEQHFRYAVLFNPQFADTYPEYLRYLLTVNKYAELFELAEKALAVPGVSPVLVHTVCGNAKEQCGLFREAIVYYKLAARKATDEYEYSDLLSDIKRVKQKVEKENAVNYIFQ